MKNPKVVIWSLVALVCIYLAFTVSWLWLIPASVIMFINQKAILN